MESNYTVRVSACPPVSAASRVFFFLFLSYVVENIDGPFASWSKWPDEFIGHGHGHVSFSFLSFLSFLAIAIAMASLLLQFPSMRCHALNYLPSLV